MAAFAKESVVSDVWCSARRIGCSVELGISVVSDSAWSSMALIRFLSPDPEHAVLAQCRYQLALSLNRRGRRLVRSVLQHRRSHSRLWTLRHHVVACLCLCLLSLASAALLLPSCALPRLSWPLPPVVRALLLLDARQLAFCASLPLRSRPCPAWRLAIAGSR